MVGGRKPRRRLRLGQAVGLASSRLLSGDENPTTAIGAGGRASQRRPFTAFKQIKIVSTGPFLVYWAVSSCVMQRMVLFFVVVKTDATPQKPFL